VSGLIVTGNFFDVLGVTPERGRLLTPGDDATPGAHPVAVISHRLWQGRFGGRPDIVGSQLRLNGSLFTVVGIVPDGFPGPQLGTQRDLFVPMMMQALMRPPRAGYSGDMDPDLLKNPRNGWLVMMALRKPSVTGPQAEAELVSVATNYLKTVNPGAPPPLLNLVPVEVGDPAVRSQLQSVAALLGCVVGAVLLIACANVANLLLSRGAARRREIAVRLALGAGRWRIVRQLLTESILLSTLGGAAGVLLAWVIVQWFTAAPPPSGALPIALEFAANQRVLVFSLLLSFATGLLFGMAPALQASRPGLVPALKDDAMTVGASRRLTLKNVLVVGEVAISCLLLVAAGLFIRSLRTVQAIDPGFAVEELASAPLNVNLLRYTRAQGREFYARVVERMEQLPGVKSATVARVALLTGSGRVTTIAVEGRPDSGARGQSEGGSVSTRAGENAMANVVGPGYFRTLGIPLLRGRDFEPRDTESAPRVAIVSESMAKQFFPGEDPIGRHFTPGATATSNMRIEIVGVARDSKYAALSEGVSPVVYFPLAQQHETGVTLYVRAAGSPETLVSQLRREIQAIEPNLPVPDVHTVRETVGTSLYVPRMGAILLTVFGGLAMLLAALGVYGVLAFSIARRTREIGIRVALGADRGRVLRLIVREGMTLVVMGLAAGLAAGWFGATAIRGFLFDVSPRDVTAFTVVPLILAAVALVACYLPARRAMRVDPMVALRDS
jgi:predicted permease